MCKLVFLSFSDSNRVVEEGELHGIGGLAHLVTQALAGIYLGGQRLGDRTAFWLVGWLAVGFCLGRLPIVWFTCLVCDAWLQDNGPAIMFVLFRQVFCWRPTHVIDDAISMIGKNGRPGANQV